MKDPYLDSILEAIASEADWTGPHLITAQELRASGALDVPPAWRKSLSAGRKPERDLFSDLIDDEEPQPDDQDSSLTDEDNDDRAD